MTINEVGPGASFGRMNCSTTSLQRGGALVPIAPMIVSKGSVLRGWVSEVRK